MQCNLNATNIHMYNEQYQPFFPIVITLVSVKANAYFCKSELLKKEKQLCNFKRSYYLAQKMPIMNLTQNLFINVSSEIRNKHFLHASFAQISFIKILKTFQTNKSRNIKMFNVKTYLKTEEEFKNLTKSKISCHSNYTFFLSSKDT